MNKRRLIVGLGNPGTKYLLTRHNLGNLTVKAMAEHYALPLKKEEKLSVKASRGVIDETSIHLVLPTTYMNDSGLAVQRYLNFFRLTAADLIVVVDDIALPFGTLRLRSGGSAGGHNGLKSIEEHLGTQQYVRLRMGIGSPEPVQELIDYVLGRFSPPEMEQLPPFLLKGVAALRTLLVHSVDVAMNLVNSKDWQWRDLNHEQ